MKTDRRTEKKEPSGKNAFPLLVRGPNGLIEIKIMNGAQGWHSGYVTPADGRLLAELLLAKADEIEAIDETPS